ncbi:unnamed protein product [Cuscuta epithymum]|uniref:COP1-interacting protein 7 n=1 Tax=Cuscuta epithymum TaxID=186058 RepID=A0AAV0ECI9_9ASTE|nr:unnamed protein product [Cuscuta epithymum]CAH9121593.1 unnamed protein product [Cuscuta epithymum]
MSDGINSNVILDYVDFQIYPSQNRYEACICCHHELEIASCGLLEQLAVHSSKVKALSLEGSDSCFRLEPPYNLSEATWFSKSTLIRFLNIINSTDILEKSIAMDKEISQLEEAQSFHFSLYAKGDDNSLTPDSSKNELMRAIDLRLTALRRELGDAFDQAAGTNCSCEDIIRIEKFSDHFGAADLRNTLQIFIRLRQANQTVVMANSKQSFLEHIDSNEPISSKGNPQLSNLSDPPVRYGASPAKAAQTERYISSESEDSSSCTAEERSRPLARPSSPRRSASPMRRVQIGRTGPRRPTALTIKSLTNHFPARVFQKDERSNSGGEEEDSEKSSKRSERMMSVQDAINLFERKQKDHQPTTVDVKKTVSVGAKKVLLRRWSSGMCGESSEDPASMASHNLETKKANLDSDSGVGEDDCEEKEPVQEVEPEDTPAVPEEALITENSRGITASAEWSRQKEAELDQLLIKMMETNPAKHTNAGPSDKKDQSALDLQGSGSDIGKPDDVDKLIGGIAKKQVGTDRKIRAKANVSSGKLSAAKQALSKRPVKRSQKPLNSSESENFKSDAIRPAEVKKVLTKAPTLPATRKSLPSTPSPRANTHAPSTATSSPATARRRSQPTTPKVEKTTPLPSTKSAKNSAGNTSDKSHPAVTKTIKPTKAHISDQTKPAVTKPNKVSKKSSVVPLESKDTPKEPKTFLRKGSKAGPTPTGPSLSPITRKKTTPQEQSLRDSVDLVEDPIIPAPTDQQGDGFIDQEGPETQPNSPPKCLETECSDTLTLENENNFSENLEENLIEEQVINISPTAWVEIEEVDSGNPSKVNVGPLSAGSPPRVRHSLSQMLMEESSEPEIVEWGNAENPPNMVYQKEAPKGFKRLLKFARKSKTDGEEDHEETRGGSKKGSDNSLLRKNTLHAHQNSTTHQHPGQATIGKLAAQKREEGHISASVTSAKAFKGSKHGESKLR